jgi:hypothetical protein
MCRGLQKIGATRIKTKHTVAANITRAVRWLCAGARLSHYSASLKTEEIKALFTIGSHVIFRCDNYAQGAY